MSIVNVYCLAILFTVIKRILGTEDYSRQKVPMVEHCRQNLFHESKPYINCDGGEATAGITQGADTSDHPEDKQIR